MLNGKILAVTLAVFVPVPGGAAQPAPSTANSLAVPQSAAVAELARQAQKALSQGNSEAAVQDYQRLVKLAPAVADYHFKLGVAYYSSDRPFDAIRPLEQALKLQPPLTAARDYLGASLAESGRCQEALPMLAKQGPHVTDQQLKRTVEADGLKCAMALDREDKALDFLRLLRRDFPKDPEVLYLTVHVYSDLSTRASQRLLTDAPASYQVHLLYAEALEAQEKWDEAATEYRRVLQIDPRLAGIRFRIGRLLLTRPKTATTMADAQHEFEGELKVDPNNAAAEYVLDEMARQRRDFPEAIEHFSHASKLDPTFADAFIGLGKALVSAGRTADAVAPLEAAVRLQAENPVAHYQLAFAYRRAGRTEDADRELAAYKQANEQARQSLQDIRSAVTGRITPAQTAEPPE
ncbi:MAG TPA: tetratricopeptide repeat protein [Terriglobia bacterium]|nr:tetratricopeptide repeat protein [Terriglobia bacterium]